MSENIEAVVARLLEQCSVPETESNLPDQISAPAEKIGERMVFWPEDAAAMPTELTRVSLFGLPADCRGKRKMLDGIKLDSRSDVEVIYTGNELCAKDQTVWLACLRIGRGIRMGERIYLDKAALLREVALSRTGPNWKTLEKRLDRLSVAHMKVTTKRSGKTGVIRCGLIKFGHIEETGAIYIRLDPEGALLFENMAYQPAQSQYTTTQRTIQRRFQRVFRFPRGSAWCSETLPASRYCRSSAVLRGRRAGRRCA